MSSTSEQRPEIALLQALHGAVKTTVDPEDLQSTPMDELKEGEESTNPIRKCSNCWSIASEGNKLKFCSKCRAVMYCSRECQLANWKSHKRVCAVNAAQAKQLAAADKFKDLLGEYPSCLPTNPTDISWVELDARLEKWIKHFGQTLMYCTIHALKLPVYFPRARTHLLRLVVKYNPDNGGKTGRFFDLDEVEVMPIDQAAQLDSAHKMSVDQLRTAREESERKGRGVVVATAIVCAPLAVQIVPFGSITPAHMKRTKWMEHWERSLRMCIATGNPNFGS